MTYIQLHSAPNANTDALSFVVLLEREVVEAGYVFDLKEFPFYVHRRWREDFGHIASQNGSGEDDRITIDQFVEHGCSSGIADHFGDYFGTFTRILSLHQKDVSQGWRVL